MKKPKYSFPVPIEHARSRTHFTMPGYGGSTIHIIGVTKGEFEWMVHAINTHVILQEKVVAAITDANYILEHVATEGSSAEVVKARRAAFGEVLGWLTGEERKEPT